MRVVLIVVAVVVLTAILYLAVTSLMERRRARGPWALQERSVGEFVEIHIVKPGEEPLWVGAVPVAAEDFDRRIVELREQARRKVDALNTKA